MGKKSQPKRLKTPDRNKAEPGRCPAPREFHQVTIKDVARHAGVSRITAARILSENPNYPASAKNRARVLATARELHYHPNPFAQSLGRRRSHIIGLCVHLDSTVREKLTHDEYLIHLDPHIAGINTHPEADRYSLMIIKRDDADPDLEINLRKKLRYLDGLIYLTPRLLHRPMLARLAEHLPLVLENAPDVRGLNTVSVNDQRAIGEAVELLAARGCRRLGLITWGTRDLCVNDSRRKAFRKALTRLGMPLREEQIASHDLGFDTRGLLAGMLERVPDLDGVIVPRDSALSTAIQEIRQSGREVGRDVAMVSMIETALCSLLQPGITAIRYPWSQLAWQSFDLLLRVIEGRTGSPRHMLLPAALAERDSTLLFSPPPAVSVRLRLRD